MAAPRSIDAVFDGLAEDLLSGRLTPRGTSCCNHAILATRLKDLGIWATLGRVLVHHMDIETLRSPKFEWTAGSRAGASGPQRLSRQSVALHPVSAPEMAIATG